MVALKFGMFRELAKTREEQAMSEVRSIKAKQLGKTQALFGNHRLRYTHIVNSDTDKAM